MNKTWWTDVKEVSDLYNAACDLDQANKLTKAIFYYRKVVNFCNSGFLPENHYETWMYPYKQRYDRIYSRCLIRLIHIHQQFEDFDDILEYAYQAISLDPCNELANLALIDVYYRQGNKPAAIQKIDDFQSMLSRDLDIQSYNKLQGLREKICMC